MPDRDVKTIRDQILFQYAKIIAKRAFSCADGEAAKRGHYGFIKKTFLDLQSGAMSWSDILREDWQLVESDKQCIYCGATQGLAREHIVPRTLRIKVDCSTCDRIQGIHNQVWACVSCNSAKGTRGLYEFYRSRPGAGAKFFDHLPVLLEKKYLKTMYCCHECARTLDKGDIDGDGAISVIDIDFILSGRQV